jgi:hypothetical protein
MFATTPLPPSQCIYQKSYVASNPTPATPAEVLDLFHLHQLFANPKHHYFQSIGKMLALRHCIRQNRSGKFGQKRYIIWISRSYRKDTTGYRMLATTNDAFSTCNATVIIRPSGILLD